MIKFAKGAGHGCDGLVDKIKLPRIPRKKMTTTSTAAPYEEETIRYIDPNCNLNLVNMYCEKLDKQKMNYLFDNTSYDDSKVPINAVDCNFYIKFSTCMQTNFRLKCQQTFQQTFFKLDKMTSNCVVSLNIQQKTNTNHKKSSNNVSASKSSNFKLSSILLIYFILKKLIS